MEQSDRYIMKCPVMMSRLGQETIYCRPAFIQVTGSGVGWGDIPPKVGLFSRGHGS